MISLLGIVSLLFIVGYVKSNYFTTPPITPQLKISIYPELERMNSSQVIPDSSLRLNSPLPAMSQPRMQKLLAEQVPAKVQRSDQPW